jgi:transketolase
MWSRLGPAGAFGLASLELAASNNAVVMLSADMAHASGLERFMNTYPDRFYNVGIAEQDLVGIASGMANEGFIPYATTYATFLATRALDQIKVNMGYMKKKINLVGVLGGLSAGIFGSTHISVEDIAAIRAIPNITILSPADCCEVIKCTLATAENDAPVYMRLTGEINMPSVYSGDYELRIGKSITVDEGTDVALIATGAMVSNSIRAAQLLREKAVSCRVINMHTIKPLDLDAVLDAGQLRLVVTVEEHSIIGGLGGAVAEALSESGMPHRLLRIGLNDTYIKAAEYGYLQDKLGLSPSKIADRIIGVLE